MTQLDLLSRSPVARMTDPYSSHLAAAAVTPTRAEQQRFVLAAIRRYPGRTSAELAAELHWCRHAFARRAPELRSAGLVKNGPCRACEVTGQKSLVWFVL